MTDASKKTHGNFQKPKPGGKISRPVDPLMQAFRERRIALGMTQEMLARRVGYNEVTIRAGETGKNNPRLVTLQFWAEALGGRLILEILDDAERAGPAPDKRPGDADRDGKEDS